MLNNSAEPVFPGDMLEYATRILSPRPTPTAHSRVSLALSQVDSHIRKARRDGEADQDGPPPRWHPSGVPDQRACDWPVRSATISTAPSYLACSVCPAFCAAFSGA